MVFDSFVEDQVNRSVCVQEAVSGKGINVTRNLKEYGVQCTNLTQLGGPRAQEFLSMCKASSISIRHIEVNSPIRTCTTIVNRKMGTSTELVQEAFPVEEDSSQKLFDLFMDQILDCSAVIITGTKARGFSNDLYPSIVRECSKRGIMTVLDMKGEDLKSCLKEGPSIIKPNLSELCATFLPQVRISEDQKASHIESQVRELLADFYGTYHTKSVISNGKMPTWIYDGEQFLSVAPNTQTIKAVNTVGCGDALTAGMAAKLIEGESLERAVAFGMECATRKAGQLFTA